MLIYNTIWRVLQMREWRFVEVKKFTKVHKIIYYKVRIQMKFWIVRIWLCRKSHVCLFVWGPRNWYCGGLANSFNFILSLFIFERERETAWAGEGQREKGDTESEAGSRLWPVSTEPYTGLKLTNREIMTWAEIGHLTDWATQVPQNSFKRGFHLHLSYYQRISFLLLKKHVSKEQI